MEKKEIKISLETVICICIIVILLIVIVAMRMSNEKSQNFNNERNEIQTSEEIGKKGNKITYKINNKSSNSSGYSERGYYVDTLNQPNAPYYYIISMGEQNTGGYSIKITDVKIDENNNVNVTVKEKEPKQGEVTTMGFTCPTCELELSEEPNSITIKDTNGNEYERKNRYENKKIDEYIKGYILTEFGPKGNMQDVTISEVNIKNEDNISLHGSCIYSITLKDPSKLTMEGSKSSVDKLEGNVYTLDADFTYDKTTNKVKFDTSYGFGN